MGISNGVKQIGIKWKTLLYSTVIQFALLMILSLLLIVVNEAVMVAQVTQASPPEIQSYNDLVLAIEEDAKKDIRYGNPCDFSRIEKYYLKDINKYTRDQGKELREKYLSACDKAKNADKWDIGKNINVTVLAAVTTLIGTLIGVFFVNPITRFFTFLQTALFAFAYRRVAGVSWFWALSLSQYRSAMKKEYGEWKNPFLQNYHLPMSTVYIPLFMKGNNSDSPKNYIDINAALRQHSKLMVIGDPGSGKTMLLRNLALSYSGKTLPGDPVTIFVELNQLSDALKEAKTVSSANVLIEDFLVSRLEELKFKKAQGFLTKRLGDEHLPLLLLLDGLDEVSGSRRDDVVKYLQAFLKQYKHCRVIITCRTQVYIEGGKKFDHCVDKTLEVKLFNDQQIRRFLYAWKDWFEDHWRHSQPDKSVEQLLQELSTRPPQVKELAKNPLLLTIIAYLYIKPDFVLPHSRSEFYEVSTTKLLNEWDALKFDVPNEFPFKAKQLLLQHLALYAEDTASDRGGDRRDLDYYQEVIPKVKGEILTKINVDPQKVEEILTEIVQRSNLLMRFADNNQKCRFTHLTLQEYFAAEYLASDLDGLLHRFDQDPEQWHEVVKLWCGNSRDSTQLIQHIHRKHPLLAFQALADAKQIDEHLAEEIIKEFQEKLGEPNQSLKIEESFGLVAADSRSPRGRKVFQFLTETLKNSNDPLKQNAAINALAHTYLPRAADHLTSHYSNSPGIREAMVRMGDITVSHLHTHARQGALFAIDDLLRIGTPDAATALADCLWSQQPSQALRAAWCLAALLPLPGITDEIKLSEKSLTEKQKAERLKMSESWKFIWDPFKSSDGDRSPVTAIAQRIAYLLETSDLKDLAAPTVPQSPEGGELQLDPRLIVPLCTLSQKLKLDLRQISQRGWTSSAEALLASHSTPETRQPSSPVIESEISDIVQEILGKTICQSDWYRLLATQPPILQLDLIGRLVKPHMRSPTAKDWRQLMLRVGQYRFERSWQFCSIVIIALLMSFLAWVICFLMILKPLGWLGFLGLAIIPAAWMWLLADGWPIPPERFLSFGILGGFTFWQELWRTNKRGIAWGGAAAMQQCFSASHIIFPAAIVVAILGAIWAVLFQNSPSIVYGLVAVAIAAMLVSMGAWAGTGLSVLMQRGWRNRFIAGSSVVVVVLAVARAIALLLPNDLHGLGWSGLGIVMMGFGVSFWANAPAKLSCWTAILTYPLFCGFPTVLACLILPPLLSSAISPMTRLIVFGILFLIATGLWFLGKSQEYHAGNPFKDLPELAQPTQP